MNNLGVIYSYIRLPWPEINFLQARKSFAQSLKELSQIINACICCQHPNIKNLKSLFPLLSGFHFAVLGKINIVLFISSAGVET